MAMNMTATASEAFAHFETLNKFLSRDKTASQRNSRRLCRQLQIAKLSEQILREKMEGIRIFRTLPHLRQFHECRSKWRMIVGGNRSSKTATCAFESCLAWLGLDPFDKYVRRCGNSIVVAMELDDIARLFRICAEPGAFKMLPDENTGEWRAVRPDPNNPIELDPYDEAYREKWRDAPPIIPPRLLPKSCISWEDYGKRIPRVIRFPSSGWRVLWRSGNGKASQGDHFHHGWLDEAIGNPLFFEEINRGLVGISEPPQHLPKGIWSATLQEVNVQMYSLLEVAKSGSEHVKSFFTTLDMNPYVPKAEREAYLATLSEEEKQFRYHGIPPNVTRAVYGMYSPMGVHGCEPFCLPNDWCRYLSLDPGTGHCGTIFGAVDPEEKHRWIYNGFDLRRASAEVWAAKVKAECGDAPFEAAIIDQQMGKQHPPGEGKTVAKQYFDALIAAGVKINTHGPLDGFYPGSKHVEARTESLIAWMHIRSAGPWAGTPMLQVFRGTVPVLDKQISHATSDRKKISKRRTIPTDMLDPLEYFAAFDPRYVTPRFSEQEKTLSIYEIYESERQNKRRRFLAGARY